MVKYTVRLPTGNEYGPADLGTLRRWKDEGRIGAGRIDRLRCAGSERRLLRRCQVIAVAS